VDSFRRVSVQNWWFQLEMAGSVPNWLVPYGTGLFGLKRLASYGLAYEGAWADKNHLKNKKNNKT
jgi:hypothetical protein